MRILRCDHCKKIVEPDEKHYHKSSNHWINVDHIFSGGKPSLELHLCIDCFAKVEQVLNESCPELLGDFKKRSAKLQ